jgi:geranylgeranyl diphosphate synthase type II
MAGGKRLRPLLCIAAAETVGSQLMDIKQKQHHPIWIVACALESIHTYSLIHDDLPALDNDQFRRGKPTCHVAFDEATAILSGDALLTVAFEWLSSIKAKTKTQAMVQMDIIHFISKAAGYTGMIEGQMRDLATENLKLNLKELEVMHRLKTGALIEASVYAGARLGGGNKKQVLKLRKFAQHIGLAFQIKDDILNVEGHTDDMGKATGTDHQRNKNTFPSILGLNKSKVLSQKVVNNALKVLEDFDSKADPLRAIAQYIIERKK